jgi:hypothetical protein
MQLVPLDVLRQMYATAAAANPPLADSEPYSGKVLFLHSQQATDLTLTVQLSVSLLVGDAGQLAHREANLPAHRDWRLGALRPPGRRRARALPTAGDTETNQIFSALMLTR